MGLDVIEPDFEDRPHALFHWSFGRDHVREAAQIVAVSLQQAQVEGPLRVEVAIEDRLGHTRSGGHVIETRPVVTAPAEQAAGRLHDERPALQAGMRLPVRVRSFCYYGVTYTSPGGPRPNPSPRRFDPIHRTSYSFRHDGDKLWVSSWLDDGAHLPEHFHPSLEERWEVLEGSASLKLNGVWLELTPEDGPVLVAPGVRHELRNTRGRQAALQTRGHARRAPRGVPNRERLGRSRGPPTTPAACRRLAACAEPAGSPSSPPLQRRDRDVLAAAGRPAGGAAADGARRALARLPVSALAEDGGEHRR